MKKSYSISAILFASTALALTACSPKKHDVPQELASLRECIDSIHNSDLCNGLYQKAQAVHVIDAPRFNDLQACEDEFGVGKCYNPSTVGQASPSETNVFIPLMEGFVLSRILTTSNEPTDSYSYSPTYVDKVGNTCVTHRSIACNESSPEFVGNRSPVTGEFTMDHTFTEHWADEPVNEKTTISSGQTHKDHSTKVHSVTHSSK